MPTGKTGGGRNIFDKAAPARPRSTLAPGGLERLQAETAKASAPADAAYNRASGGTQGVVPGFKAEDLATIRALAKQYPQAAGVIPSLTNPIEWAVGAVKGAQQLGRGVKQIATGDVKGGAANAGLGALGLAAVFPVGRSARALHETAGVVDEAAAGAAAYAPRTVTHNDLTVQVLKPRSRIAQTGLALTDKASELLQKTAHVKDLPGMRLLTPAERVAKNAGRAQRVERVRAAAAQAEHLNAIKAIKAGSPEDVANFWYAQLPKAYRNETGLSLVRAKQAEELQRITSGRALDALAAQEKAVRAKLGETEDMKAKGPLLQQLEDIRLARTDLSARADDISASLGQLDGLIAKPPAVNDAAIRAVHDLGNERQRILVESGRLHPSRAEARKGLLSRALGLEPTGEEAYIGHRLAKPENARYPYVPSGGTGKVKSPQGMSRNDLVLATTGRLRPSLRIAAEDFGAAQVFHQANVARADLGALGDPFTGHVPAGYSLVNPKGRTIPADWKNEDLAQFQDGYEDIDTIREQAKQILDGFIAQDRPGFERLKKEALEQGVHWDELRVIPNRLVERYYSQFRPLRSRGPAGKAYDSAIDAVSTSIVFARIGYIPKNFVQNLILALPHQGPMLLVNATRAAQAMADPELRRLLQAEVGHTGATGALANEAFSKKITGAIASGVSKVADDPVRMSAFMHEAAAHGVISKVNPLLTDSDRAALIRLLTDKSERPRLNDIRQAGVEAMADFSRLTPDQSRMARRFLIIPGWLMAGSRYPFHFGLTHPIRSALLAYIALGEPGAPDELHFNHPINEYFHGTGYRQGIDTPYGRIRTSSLNPVTTPFDLAQAVVGSVRGKTGPFDYLTPTVFDEVQPLLAAGVKLAQGEGVGRSVTPLAPNYGLVRGLISPKESASYPGDATRFGRLKREIGVVPIPVNDSGSSRGRGGGNIFDGGGSSGGSSGNIFDK